MTPDEQMIKFDRAVDEWVRDCACDCAACDELVKAWRKAMEEWS